MNKTLPSVAARHVRSNSDAGPVFIGGCMRSGTTVLMQLLDCSRDIALPPTETYFCANFLGATHRARTDTLPSPAESLPYMARLSHGALKGHCESEDVIERAKEAGSYAEVFDAVASAMARSVGKTRWADKTPGNEFFASEILRIFPGSRFVYVVRDYRDVVASNRDRMIDNSAALPSRLIAVKRAAFLWRASLLAHLWNVHHLDSGRYMTIRYEDLIMNPPKLLSRLSTFVQSDLANILEKKNDAWYFRPLGQPHVRRLGRSNSADQDAGWESNRLDSRSIGRHRQKLNRVEVALADLICGRLGGLVGYRSKTHPTSSDAFDVSDRRMAGPLTGKGKFWFGQKGRRINDPL